MNLVFRLRRLFQSKGFRESFRTILRYLHSRLPKRKREYQGTKVRDGFLFDPLLPWQSDENQHHESGIVSGINKHVNPGDRVVIVGGGKGVTAVIAAKNTGKGGRVDVYEGAKNGVKQSVKTAQLNNVTSTVSVHHSIVGPPKHLSGTPNGASRLSPQDLPECDVLELDCEGAEISILESLNQQPRVILVESHGIYGSTSDEVMHILAQKGYSVVSKAVANEGMREEHTDNDIYAITALRK